MLGGQLLRTRYWNEEDGKRKKKKKNDPTFFSPSIDCLLALCTIHIVNIKVSKQKTKVVNA